MLGLLGQCFQNSSSHLVPSFHTLDIPHSHLLFPQGESHPKVSALRILSCPTSLAYLSLWRFCRGIFFFLVPPLIQALQCGKYFRWDSPWDFLGFPSYFFLSFRLKTVVLDHFLSVKKTGILSYQLPAVARASFCFPALNPLSEGIFFRF